MTATITIKAADETIVVDVNDYEYSSNEDGSMVRNYNSYERLTVQPNTEVTLSLYGNRSINLRRFNEKEGAIRNADKAAKNPDQHLVARSRRD